MNIGFDVDGVISKGIFGSDKLLRYYRKGWNLLLYTPLGKFLYDKFRRVNKEMREAIRQLQTEGHRIIIVTYVFEKHRSEVARWLRKNKIPHDKVFLPQEGESLLVFKVRVILEQGCDYYVEDQSGLARGIALRVPEVRVIHYRGKEDLRVLL